MNHWLAAIQIVCGVAAGALMAWVYMLLLRKQIRDITEKGRSPAFLGLGYLVRLSLFGGAMSLLLWWRFGAGLAYALAFLLTRAWLLRRDPSSRHTPGDTAV